MSEDILVSYCAPTLAGIKTGNLFGYRCRNSAQAQQLLRSWNNQLNQKGVYARILQYTDNRALIYVYRPERLQQVFGDEKIRNFLESCGYEETGIEAALRKLGTRIRRGTEFPHEIGVFLGYPIEDVLAFIDNKGKNYKDALLWKVYDNVDEARKTCRMYRKCTEVYRRRITEGFSIQRLTVAGCRLQ